MSLVFDILILRRSGFRSFLQKCIILRIKFQYFEKYFIKIFSDSHTKEYYERTLNNSRYNRFYINLNLVKILAFFTRYF